MKKINITYKYEMIFTNIRYYMYKLNNFFKKIKTWFSYRKVIFNIYDFDYQSVLEVERFQLERLYNNINSCVDYKLSKEKIKILMDLYDAFFDNDILDINNLKLKKYVNAKNASRFNLKFSDFDPENPYHLNELYIEKIWSLIHKIRIQYMRDWWD